MEDEFQSGCTTEIAFSTSRKPEKLFSHLRYPIVLDKLQSYLSFNELHHPRYPENILGKNNNHDRLLKTSVTKQMMNFCYTGPAFSPVRPSSIVAWVIHCSRHLDHLSKAISWLDIPTDELVSNTTILRNKRQLLDKEPALLTEPLRGRTLIRLVFLCLAGKNIR